MASTVEARSRRRRDVRAGAGAGYLMIAARYDAMARDADASGDATRAVHQREAATTFRALAASRRALQAVG